MMLFTAVVLVALASSGVQGRVQKSNIKETASGNSCTLNLQEDLDSAKEPLILTPSGKSWNFVWPKTVYAGKGVVTVEDGSSLLLACPGAKNHHVSSGEQTAYATCSKGKLMIGKHAVNNETTSCSKVYAESSVHVTKEPCGSKKNSGVIVKLGFELEDGSWYPLVDVCHNLEQEATLYATHQVYGASLKGGVKSSERRSFARGPKPLYPNLNPESVYIRSGQIKAFDDILGHGGADKYISSSSFLARGHLAPDADFIYNSGQLLTYYHVNIAPQWQCFNAGNWLGIETAVRNIAGQVAETLNVWTGTYGVLKLADTHGKPKEIFLESSKKLIPAPELYWKLVQNPKDKTCTVAIGANNPFLEKAPACICSKVSPKGWPSLETLNKGYVYYCNYKDFKSVVDFVPDVDCKGGLFELH